MALCSFDNIIVALFDTSQIDYVAPLSRKGNMTQNTSTLDPSHFDTRRLCISSKNKPLYDTRMVERSRLPTECFVKMFKRCLEARGLAGRYVHRVRVLASEASQRLETLLTGRGVVRPSICFD